MALPLHTGMTPKGQASEKAEKTAKRGLANWFYEPKCRENDGGRTRSSAVERALHTREVTGSIPVASTTSTLAIALCTCRRPKMLARCLDSLANQILPDDIAVSLVVVDNDPDGGARLAIAKFAAIAPFPVYYVHQPERGIARARNTAIDKAMELRADWIAMLDDDERAAPDWLACLMTSIYRHVPVLCGANHTVYPTPRPFWAPEDLDAAEDPADEGQRCKTAYTGNVRFSTDLIRAGLRFDEQLGFMGGEDNEFFAKAHAMGFEIRRTIRAMTFEEAHPERCTYRALVYRSYWCSASEFRRLRIMRGRAGAMLRKAHTIPLNLLFGAGWMLAGVIAAPFSKAWFRSMVLEGSKKLAKSAGRAAALLGHCPQPYRTIHGA